MAQRVMVHSIDPVPFIASQRQSVDIPRGTLIREIILELSSTISASAGNAITDANILPGDEWAVISEIRVVANSNQVLRRFSGEQLRMWNYFTYGANARVSPLAVGVAAAGTLAMTSILRIPFWSPLTHTPVDTLLDTRGMASLKLEVDWGTIASVTSATGAAYTVNPSLKLAMYHQDGDGVFSATRIYPMRETAVAVNDRKRIQLPVDSMYKAILINTKESDAGFPDAATAGTFISNIKLLSGPTVFYDMPGSMLRDWGMLRSFVPTIHDDAGAAIDEPFASAGTFLNSWYYLDLVGPDGYLTEMIDSVGLSEFTLELNVGTLIDVLTVMPFQVYPVRKVA